MSTTICGPGGYDTTKPHNNILWQADDATRTVTDYATNPPTSRPYTAAENTAADRQAADAARRAVAGQLVTDTTADLTKLQQAITDLAVLLGDNTTAGSLRQWRSSVTNQYSAATLRALADLVITEAQVTRRVARQTLRLARQMAGDYSSANMGTDI